MDYERLLSSEKSRILIYFHGNAWTRSAPHRIKLYNIFAAAGYHVVALDYRGERLCFISVICMNKNYFQTRLW